MRYDPRAVANRLLDFSYRDNIDIGLSKILKLIYICHGFHLALTDKPLLNTRTITFPYGPWYDSVYYAFIKMGNSTVQDYEREEGFYPVSRSIEGHTIEEDCFESVLIERVWKTHKHISKQGLLSMVIQQDSPWYKTWHEEGGKEYKGTPICDEKIKEYFKKIADNADRKDDKETKDAFKEGFYWGKSKGTNPENKGNPKWETAYENSETKKRN